MPTIKLDVDSETYDRLVEQAVVERRPTAWQAEVTLRRAVGLPFPAEAEGEGNKPPTPIQAAP